MKYNMSYEEKINKLLRATGVQQHLLGWDYIKYAILTVHDEGGVSKVKMMCVYSKVAKYFNTTSSRVERAMRHAIESAFTYARLEGLHKLFGNTIDVARGKASTMQFVSACVRCLDEEEALFNEITTL